MDSILNEYLGSAQLSASLIIPVVVVIISAVLVFICGFRKPKEPQFRKIAASVEASIKKTKRKEKPQTTSTKTSAQNVAVKTSQPAASATEPKKQASAAATKKESQPQQQQAATKKKEATQKKTQASQKAVAPAKKEKTQKPEKVKKPADFDDGGWTTVPSRTDKKKNKEDLLLSQALDSALGQTGKKTDAKSSKNPKQLKDQANKSKKEAADNKNKKKSASANEETEQVNNKVVDTIENLVNELKKKDSSNELITSSAPSKKKQDIDSLIESAAIEKSDDSKPVPEGGVVFNEMEDTWTEAKAPKKGKKKARKD